MIAPKILRDRRQELGLTQIDVAVAVGVSAGGYRLWEAGGMKPSPENEMKLRQVLQLEGNNDDNTNPAR
jgi:transcriptional regulator with XRE-family HTH domain